MTHAKYLPVLIIAPTILALGLAACHGSTEATALPAGQVVAQVGGHDITVNELDAELTGAHFASQAQRSHAAEKALQGLIARTILANIARDQKLDQDPSYVLQQHRANEILLVQNLQADIAGKAPAPTDSEVSAYMTAHPELFAKRAIYALDQIKFQAPDEPSGLKAYAPLTTLRDIEQKLIEDRTPYNHTNATLDILTADPSLAGAIARLPNDEVFLVPKNDVIYANHIISAKIEPFSGPRAHSYATVALQNASIEHMTLIALKEKIKAAEAKIRYQAGYAPHASAAR